MNSIKSFEEGEVKSTKRDTEEEETLERELVLLKKKLEEEGRKQTEMSPAAESIPCHFKSFCCYPRLY